jgi:hypothetical protein
VVGSSRIRAVDAVWPAAESRILHSIATWPAVNYETDEVGDAITAGGEVGLISANPSGPQPLDWATISIVVIVCGATAVGEFLAVGISQLPPPVDAVTLQTAS